MAYSILARIFRGALFNNFYLQLRGVCNEIFGLGGGGSEKSLFQSQKKARKEFFRSDSGQVGDSGRSSGVVAERGQSGAD